MLKKIVPSAVIMALVLSGLMVAGAMVRWLAAGTGRRLGRLPPAGATPASARLAVDFCEGWLPGRITFPTYQVRVDKIRAMTAEIGNPLPIALPNVERSGVTP